MLLLALFSVIGCLLKLLRFPLPPIVLAFVLGDRLEAAFRQSLVLTDGNPLVFFTRPISGSVLAIAVIVVIVLKARRAPVAAKTPAETP
ncbi:hypothetical protein ITP53_15725 [Nonomuraea sp. K274]|uniref:Uncharacterized protein n=1 Tax=Nonomuraea cypriaca TaxID=1187855 RepID=A0A931F0I7_9ACTN|nr:hypothetical protein [Nonomuraea cypriaca]MBF8187161.1 hypothetical protein [Nonomuraea cypriaca]